MDYRECGLYEPKDDMHDDITKAACAEFDAILGNFVLSLKAWRLKHVRLGARDTAGRDAQIIAIQKAEQRTAV
jgi:hypothetical protein